MVVIFRLRCVKTGCNASHLWPVEFKKKILTIQWRHNERDGVANHQHLDCLLIRFFRRTSTKHQSSTSLAFVGRIHRILISQFIVRRAGLLWSQQDFEWRWSVPLFKCLTVLEFSFIMFDLCLLITFFNFIMNYVTIVTFWIFTYYKF